MTNKTEKLLKIADFAELVGVSKQTIYNHIQTNRKDLNQFVKKVESVVFIDSGALSLYQKEGQDNSNLNDFESNFNSKSSQNNSNLDSFLMAQITEKDKQLEEKDAQIKRLTELLEKEKEPTKEKDKLLEESIKHFQEQELCHLLCR